MLPEPPTANSGDIKQYPNRPTRTQAHNCCRGPQEHAALQPTMLCTGMICRDPEAGYENLMVTERAPLWIAMLNKWRHQSSRLVKYQSEVGLIGGTSLRSSISFGQGPQ